MRVTSLVTEICNLQELPGVKTMNKNGEVLWKSGDLVLVLLGFGFVLLLFCRLHMFLNNSNRCL